MKSFLSLASVFIAACNLCAQTSGTWSPDNGGNGHYYEVITSPNPISWTSARDAATARGGYLATITSAAENAFIYGLGSPTNPWIGGYQTPGAAEPAGGWNWVTNEPFTYTNWFPGSPGHEAAPNNTLDYGGEDKLEFYQSLGGTWNDLPNSHPFAFTYRSVVEYGRPSQSPPIPTTAPSINLLPAANGQALSIFTGSVLTQHSGDFSPESLAYLTTTAQSTAPLIDPVSSKNLKNSIANGLATGLEHAATAINLTQNAISVAAGEINSDQAAFNVAIPFAINKSNMPAFIALSLAKDAFEASQLAKVNPQAATVSFLISLNATIYGDILAPQLRLFGQDPPNPNFQSIFIPTLTNLTLPTTGNAQLDAALQKQTNDLQQAAVYLQAVNASFDKYGGAIQSADSIHAVLQMEALLNYLKLYNQSAQDAAGDAQTTKNLLTSLGIAMSAYNPQQLIDLQSNVAANGLPSELGYLLTQLNLTSYEMDQVTQGVLNLDPYAYSGTLAGASDTASNTLLQGTTLGVPEPRSTMLVFIGFLGIIQIRSRKRHLTK